MISIWFYCYYLFEHYKLSLLAKGLQLFPSFVKEIDATTRTVRYILFMIVFNILK